MWQNLKEFTSHYKSTLIKLSLALLFVFMIVHYNSYGKRSSAHYLNLQIRNGQIAEICIAPSQSIKTDRKGTFAVADRNKIYIPADEWADITPREDLNLAITFRSGLVHRIYEIDDINARIILQGGKKEGCRGFYRKKAIVVK